mmetsp:Transcript_1542/g.2895  ORF Transcript_1542/g.2895 Transcript_1542/m.2895 type:complete len:525 (+) Transcript_1542:146-1720(+)
MSGGNQPAETKEPEVLDTKNKLDNVEPEAAMVAKEAQFSDGEAHASPAPSDTSVVVAFVNSKSGGKAGPKLHKMLCDALGDDKVVDLAMMKTDENQNPVNALKRFAGTEGLRVLVCGGDGTCSWLFASMYEADCHPPLAVMPLGTGNDFSRTLGWGSGFTKSMLKKEWLDRVYVAKPRQMDLWNLSIQPTPGRPDKPSDINKLPPAFREVKLPASSVPGAKASQQQTKSTSTSDEQAGGKASAGTYNETAPQSKATDADASAKDASSDEQRTLDRAPTHPGLLEARAAAAGDGTAATESEVACSAALFSNYVGIGLEAAALYAFHVKRESKPQEFNGRIKNQLLMGRYGLPRAAKVPQLASRLRVDCRREAGGAWEPLVLPPKLKALMFVNIPSHAAGRNAWGTQHVEKKTSSEQPEGETTKQAHDFGDGLIEVCGISSALHGFSYLALNVPLGHGAIRNAHLLRIAQVAELRLELLEPLHIQIDGEPWLQQPSFIHLSLHGQTPVLVPPTYKQQKASGIAGAA